jgi:tRNA1Val (adenine37-N6)-methyltransferase
MGGNHFQFKQFAVSQSRCAMKVSTDACLLGAWAPFRADIASVLDIGCGTGLLSLMTAQRFSAAHITGLELDSGAAGEATENIEESLWRRRLQVIAGDVLTFDFATQKFEGIICNPPFFQKSLGAQSATRHAARHDDHLPIPHLFAKIEELLPAGGQLALLLPPVTQVVWEALAMGSTLTQVEQLQVKPLPHKAPNRILSLWKKSTSVRELQIEELTIYETYGNYTPTAKVLLAPFLLNL